MEKKGIRLARFLSHCGAGSRRKCEEYIFSGKVSVNGKIVKSPNVNVFEGDRVFLSGKKVEPENILVLALNKPAGYISTARDEFGRKTVVDFVKDIGVRLYPAGRLDKDSRGLLLLTNDGGLVQRIIHPKFCVPKKYIVILEKPLSKDAIRNINSGIVIDDKNVRVSDFRIIETKKNYSKIEITIFEGRKRIIRRMFDKINYKVIDLQRIQIGNYVMKGIPEGKYKILSDKDISRLQG